METLIHYGGEVKALGDGRFRAPLVLFGREAKDLDGDFFTPETDLWQDFAAPVSVPFLYAHGLDPELKHAKLGDGKVSLTKDAAGVWMEGQLKISDGYQAKIYEMIEAGRIGTSSGSIAHLVTRRAEGKAYELKSWPLAEASLTPRPCNPLNVCHAVKDFRGLDIPEFKDVMTTAAGYAPQNNRNAGVVLPPVRPVTPGQAGRDHEMTPGGHGPDGAARCPSCHLWAHFDADHLTCPYCGVHLSAADQSSTKDHLSTKDRSSAEDAPDAAPAAKSAGVPFGEELDAALAAVESCTGRAAGIHLLRSVKSGRSLSAANRAKLRAAHDGLAELLRLTEPEGEPPATPGVDALLAELTASEVSRSLAAYAL